MERCKRRYKRFGRTKFVGPPAATPWFWNTLNFWRNCWPYIFFIALDFRRNCWYYSFWNAPEFWRNRGYYNFWNALDFRRNCEPSNLWNTLDIEKTVNHIISEKCTDFLKKLILWQNKWNFFTAPPKKTFYWVVCMFVMCLVQNILQNTLSNWQKVKFIGKNGFLLCFQNSK